MLFLFSIFIFFIYVCFGDKVWHRLCGGTTHNSVSGEDWLKKFAEGARQHPQVQDASSKYKLPTPTICAPIDDFYLQTFFPALPPKMLEYANDVSWTYSFPTTRHLSTKYLHILSDFSAYPSANNFSSISFLLRNWANIRPDQVFAASDGQTVTSFLLQNHLMRWITAIHYEESLRVHNPEGLWFLTTMWLDYDRLRVLTPEDQADNINFFNCYEHGSAVLRQFIVDNAEPEIQWYLMTVLARAHARLADPSRPLHWAHRFNDFLLGEDVIFLSLWEKYYFYESILIPDSSPLIHVLRERVGRLLMTMHRSYNLIVESDYPLFQQYPNESLVETSRLSSVMLELIETDRAFLVHNLPAWTIYNQEISIPLVFEFQKPLVEITKDLWETVSELHSVSVLNQTKEVSLPIDKLLGGLDRAIFDLPFWDAMGISLGMTVVLLLSGVAVTASHIFIRIRFCLLKRRWKSKSTGLVFALIFVTQTVTYRDIFYWLTRNLRWLLTKIINLKYHWVLGSFGLPAVRGSFFLKITLYLSILFLSAQSYEYLVSPIGISSSIFGSLFFMLTGFHGFHVVVGTIFLFWCFLRYIKGWYTALHHNSFESAIWYWHFVDIVWIFLYGVVYLWGAPVEKFFLFC